MSFILVLFIYLKLYYSLTLNMMTAIWMECLYLKSYPSLLEFYFSYEWILMLPITFQLYTKIVYDFIPMASKEN